MLCILSAIFDILSQPAKSEAFKVKFVIGIKISATVSLRNGGVLPILCYVRKSMMSTVNFPPESSVSAIP